MWNKLGHEQKLERLKKSFEKKVIKKEGCWDWKGYQQNGGYFLIRYNLNKILAHRASWLIYKGEIPKDFWILHKCDNRRCTNPDHLFLGTAIDNARDRDNKGKGQQGEKHHKHKLSENDVIKIRERLTMDEKRLKIAQDYGVSEGTIWFIEKTLTWKCVPKGEINGCK